MNLQCQHISMSPPKLHPSKQPLITWMGTLVN